MRIRLLPALVLTLAAGSLAGCGSSTQATGVPTAPRANIHVQQDPAADFAGFRTYAWVDRSTVGEAENTGLDAEMDGMIVHAVDSVLAAKGYQRATSNPDLRVVWYGAFTGRVEEHEAKQRYPSYFQRENSVAFTSTQQVTTHWEDGTFILDVLDGASDELVWSVHAEGAIQTSGNPEVMQQRLNEGAERVLEQFPRR